MAIDLNVASQLPNIQNYSAADRPEFKRSEQKSQAVDVRDQVTKQAFDNESNRADAVLRLEASENDPDTLERGSVFDILV